MDQTGKLERGKNPRQPVSRSNQTFTGPAGRDLGPAIPAADKALEEGPLGCW